MLCCWQLAALLLLKLMFMSVVRQLHLSSLIWMTNGFALENYLDADVELTFGGDVERSGEGDVYGEITITNLTLSQEYYVAGASYVNIDEAAVNATTGTHWSEAPVWTAKIVAGDFYVKVSGGESLRARRDVMANVLDDFSLIALSYKGAYPQLYFCPETCHSVTQLQMLQALL